MKNEPLASICIPSYNHAQFLPEAIESALSQTYRNIEIIIVDDGSTDNSLEIAQSYAAKHSIIEVYTHPNNSNCGISRTADLAIKKMRGKYWSACCSDDVLYPDKIETEVNYLEENPQIALVYGYMDAIDAKGELIPNRRMGMSIADAPDQLEALLASNAITAPSIMARKEALDQVGKHEENLIYSDWLMWIRFAASFKIGFIGQPLVKYRIHDYNTSVVDNHLIHYKRMREMYSFLREQAQDGRLKLSEEKYRQIINEQLKAIPAEEARFILDKYYTAIGDKNFSVAAGYLKKAIQTSPRTTLTPRKIASVIKQAMLGAIKAV